MKRIMLSLLLFAASVVLYAQQPDQLPVDPNVRYGHLDNGMTYYIRHNEMPKQRCEFHIAQAVGAILEEDNQNGLAHFLEHMAFNGTEHFPGKGIITYFESVGVNFGGNINAYTSIDETVYRLSDVPTYREGIVDSALLVLHDWSCGLLLLPEEIDAERGVIREEWRTGRTAQRRLWAAVRAKQYPGTQYAKRDVIGDTAVINNFAYDALRAYYKKWYGPDNQAIIIVGDIDVDSMEQKVRDLFGPIPARANRGERPVYTVELNDKPLVAIATDAEAQQTNVQLDFKHDQLPAQYQNTQAAYANSLVQRLIASMLNKRFRELSLDPKASFRVAYAAYVQIAKLKDAFTAIYVAKEGQETAALKDLLIQVEKMQRYGFTSTELEMAKTDLLNTMEKSYNERNTRKNIAVARECIRNFEDNEPMPGIEWEYEFTKQILPMLSLEAVNKAAEAMIDDNPTVSITGPDKQGVNIPSEAAVLDLLKEVNAMDIEAPKEETVDTELVKRTPRAGKIKKTTYNETLGTTEWLLSNGAKVVIKPTEFKQDEIRLMAFSNGGMSLVKTEDLPSATIATDAVEMMGLGDFSMTDLQKALTGKTVSLSPKIGQFTDLMEGASSVKDLESMLKLLYLYFTDVRRDQKAYDALINMYKNALINKDKNPKAVFADSVSLFSSNHSPRTVLKNTEMLDKVSLDRALSVFKSRFSRPADFTFIFVGNIDPNDAATQQLICQWIGSIKGSKKAETFRDNGTRTPLGLQKDYFTRKMSTTTATNRIQYTSYDMPYSLANSLNMTIIGRILSTRYLESIREREGGSYGVGCYGAMDIRPVSRARLIMQFDTDPAKQAKLMSIIHDEVNTIVKDGPLASDLQKEKEQMLKDFQEDLQKNDEWTDNLFMYYLYGINYITDYVPAVKNITAETVQQTLKKLVDAQNMFEVVMSPEE